MSYRDLEKARRHCEDMRELIIQRMGGAEDHRALQKVQELSRRASSAVADRECRERLGAIEDYACDLFSETEHRKWACGETNGAAVLRLQILRELDQVRGRLDALQALRDAVSKHQAA